MRWIHSLGIAFSMYSKIPVPKVRWTNEAMQYTFCFFPLVGVAEGALLWGMGMVLYGLRDRNRLPAIFVAIVLTILPLLVTGGDPYGWLPGYDGCQTFLPSRRKSLPS
ncbi:adenosylcobinamide-GDP ribazoletransferase [Sellimonas intestinalis]|uniref:adenosylcobinamide-GDP ribazoletransferase n=1 Tax=Sellimonas intestinalis TaxID=1653434 RepID=UPI0039998FFC